MSDLTDVDRTEAGVPAYVFGIEAKADELATAGRVLGALIGSSYWSVPAIKLDFEASRRPLETE